MAREALNKVRYRQFAQKCRGARIGKVTVNKEDRKVQLYYRYNARALKGGKRFNGEWVVDKKGRSEDDLKTSEKSFFDLVREDFMLSKGNGFSSGNEADAASESPEAKTEV
jgi:hypothetical protein